MSSQRKINSARANGAKSHGPVTESGRKRSSMNALKHGLTARTVILDNEDKDEYKAFLDAYLRDLNPAGAVEMDLVVEMVNAKWRQRRLCLIEAELFDDEIETQKPELDKAYLSYTQAVEYSAAFNGLEASGKTSLAEPPGITPRTRLLPRPQKPPATPASPQRQCPSRPSARHPRKKGEKRTQSQKRPEPSNEKRETRNEKRAPSNEKRETRNEQRSCANIRS
jgi:hypothetical protein